MTDKIKAFVKAYDMIAEGDTVIAGISGGADSVCLLLILQNLQKEMAFTVRAVHVEHGVRGADSRDDAAFTERLCRNLGVSFVQYAYDVPQIAAERGISVEETGRLLRYQAFEAEAAKYEHGKIAVAHNKNDNVETMLFHLVRGSDGPGAAGIAPVRGKIIRPLLCVEREEIEKWLSDRGQDYRTDATNFEMIYTRNAIRHQVLPVLKKINPRAVSHMAETAKTLREMQEYMMMQEKEAEKNVVRYDAGGVQILGAQAEELPAVMRNMLLYETLAACAGSRKNIAKVHVEALAGLFHKQVGRTLMLPYGIFAKRNYDGIFLKRQEESTVFCQNISQKKEAIPLMECADFTCDIFEKPGNWKDFPKKKYTKWLDYDKIKNRLYVRNRQAGDFFYLKEDGGAKKLKQYFIDEKIPGEQRDKVILVADASHIVWVVGHRISAGYKITENTQRILRIVYNGGREDE